MVKNKKFILAIASLLLLVAIFFGVKFIRAKSIKVDVVPANTLNSGFYEEESSMEAIVTDSDSQNIRLEQGQIVNKVYVKEDQSVNPGDKLLSFNLSAQEISYGLKEIEILKAKNNLEKAQAELYRLTNLSPSEIQSESSNSLGLNDEDREYDNKNQTKRYDAVNILTNQDVDKFFLLPSDSDKTALQGSLSNPYRYLVTEDGKVYGSFFNKISEDKPSSFVVVEVRKGDRKTGQLIASWTFNTAHLHNVERDDSWYVISRSSGQSKFNNPAPDQEKIERDKSKDSNQPMTKAELTKAIIDKQIDIKNLDLEVRRGQLGLEGIKIQMKDGVVYAKSKGIVKKAEDPSNPPQDGSPFLKVQAGKGIYAKGTVSELMLNRIKPGLTMTESNNSYVGKVVSVDKFPTDHQGTPGAGNPNSSYYGYTIHFSDAEKLETGKTIQLKIKSEQGQSKGLYIQNAYIRTDNKGSFVMKDYKGKLKKQYVKCGKVFYGEMTRILDGITEKDYLAFPYGPGIKEGLKTQISEKTGDF